VPRASLARQQGASALADARHGCSRDAHGHGRCSRASGCAMLRRQGTTRIRSLPRLPALGAALVLAAAPVSGLRSAGLADAGGLVPIDPVEVHRPTCGPGLELKN
jgi:hypothetical protein